MKNDHVGVLETAYSALTDDAGWVDQLARACRPLLDEGLGVGAWTYYSLGGEAQELDLKLHHRAVVGGPETLLQRMDAWSQEISPALLARLYRTKSVGCFVASQRLGRSVLNSEPAMMRNLHPLGVFDLVALTTPDPDGYGVGVVSFCPRASRVSRRATEMWGRIGVHLAAAYRLRRNASSQASVAEAILTPNGKVLHAEPPAKALAARTKLREAAISMDRARTTKGRSHPEDAVALWRALVAGQWTLVDRFEADGRRLVVARRNSPETAARNQLTPREGQVASYLGLGQSNKLIAYSLGISESVVSETTRRIFSKLGVQSRAELAQLSAAALYARQADHTSEATTSSSKRER